MLWFIFIKLCMLYLCYKPLNWYFCNRNWFEYYQPWLYWEKDPAYNTEYKNAEAELSHAPSIQWPRRGILNLTQLWTHKKLPETFCSKRQQIMVRLKISRSQLEKSPTDFGRDCHSGHDICFHVTELFHRFLDWIII